MYKQGKIIKELEEFMCQLFPEDDLRTYMWEHLASCLIGTNSNQTFNIYKGSGRNGKSKLVELMGKGLGSYKGTVPITLITQKRNTIGSTSSEVAQLMGVRYAVMQEMSKGDLQIVSSPEYETVLKGKRTGKPPRMTSPWPGPGPWAIWLDSHLKDMILSNLRAARRDPARVDKRLPDAEDLLSEAGTPAQPKRACHQQHPKA